jgi:mannonate dehydratase
MFYDPAGGARPREETWSSRLYLETIGEVFAAVRDRFGPELELLHGAHHRLARSCGQLLREGLVDFIRMSVSHSGGITHLRRVLHLPELHGVRSGFPGATDLSPICVAAALHLDLAIPNSACRSTCATRLRRTPCSLTGMNAEAGTCIRARNRA